MNGEPVASGGGGMTGLGKAVLTLVVLGVVGFGGWKWYQGMQKPAAPAPGPGATVPAPATAPVPGSVPAPAAAPAGPMPSTEEVVEPLSEPAALPAGVAYVPKDGTLDIEISDYAGYAGLVAANGGLEPSEASWFFRKHGFKVRLRVEESEGFDKLQKGEIAASVTTADVLPVLGKRFHGAVPVMLGYSRGADALVVRSDIKRVNDLKGKVVASVQYLENDFFLRYLASEAGLEVNVLPSLDTPADPAAVNVVYCDDAPRAASLFLKFVKANHPGLAGFVAWAPATTDAVRQSGGKAFVRVDTKDILVVADVLVVNKGFSAQNPKMAAGLVEGILEGNRWIRADPAPHMEVLAKAFGRKKDEIAADLKRVHFANLAENLAFFSGNMDAGGSFNWIYQTASYGYRDTLKDAPDADRFADLSALKAIQASGAYKDDQVAIRPSREGGRADVEKNPLLNKDIRFQFEPNSDSLDMKNPANLKALESVRNMLRIAPGSQLILRGHVSAEKVKEFKEKGEPFFRKASLQAVDMSKRRAKEIQRILVDQMGVPSDRSEVEGKGWEQPLPGEPEMSRRVEVLWYTLE